jgi:transposase
MLKITFDEAAVQALQTARFEHPQARVRVKMEALYLKSQGFSHQEIAYLCAISVSTLGRYLKVYQEGGIQRLQHSGGSGPDSALEPHRAKLEAAFREQPPLSVAEAAARIKTLTDVERKPTQVRAFLKSLGMKPRKVGTLPAKALPAKADVQRQAEFRDSQLQPRLEEAKTGQRAVFFVDAAHFVYGPFLGWVWCFARLLVKAPAGRQRLNVLAALHATTQQLITVSNLTYITAHSVCLLLERLAYERDSRLHQPLTVVLDNAPYQRCALVQECAHRLRIELLYLPPYSPNLNLIERFWRFVKKQCLYCHYHADFAAFQKAILECIEQAPQKHQAELKSLLTLRFQTFEKASLLAA